MTIHIHKPGIIPDIQPSIATLGDADEAQQLMVETARWLHSKGSTQWGGLLKGQDDHNLSAAIERREVIIFKDVQSGELAGMVILQQQPSEWDRNLWGLGQDDPGTSVYLHRLVVSRKYGGTGLGENILAWAESGVTYKGKDRIRLDCIAHNEVLNRFYQQCGYTYKGEVKGFSIFEKRLRLPIDSL